MKKKHELTEFSLIECCTEVMGLWERRVVGECSVLFHLNIPAKRRGV